MALSLLDCDRRYIMYPVQAPVSPSIREVNKDRALCAHPASLLKIQSNQYFLANGFLIDFEGLNEKIHIKWFSTVTGPMNVYKAIKNLQIMNLNIQSLVTMCLKKERRVNIYRTPTMCQRHCARHMPHFCHLSPTIVPCCNHWFGK